MKEDVMNEPKNQSEEGAGTAAASEDKMFTQDEVNQIVSDRLQRERKKADDAQDTALSDREAELCAREARIAVKETLIKEGMPPELADVIRGTSEDEMNKNIEVLKKYLQDKRDKDEKSKKRPCSKIGSPLGPGDDSVEEVDPYRRVMGLK